MLRVEFPFGDLREKYGEDEVEIDRPFDLNFEYRPPALVGRSRTWPCRLLVLGETGCVSLISSYFFDSIHG